MGQRLSLFRRQAEVRHPRLGVVLVRLGEECRQLARPEFFPHSDEWNPIVRIAFGWCRQAMAGDAG